MDFPVEIPVMTLPQVSLFPQAMLPLYIFEPRYRRMLADVLAAQRMFAVAMRKTGSRREAPSKVAGLGLVRACVQNRDGTSNLVLQGLSRIELREAVRYRPYRVHACVQLPTPPSDDPAVDALAARLRELVSRFLELKTPAPPTPVSAKAKPPALPVPFSLQRVVDTLARNGQPSQLADLVACTLLSQPEERQAVLESAGLCARLRRVIRFLSGEIQQASSA